MDIVGESGTPVFVREWMFACADPAENWLSREFGVVTTRRKDEEEFSWRFKTNVSICALWVPVPQGSGTRGFFCVFFLVFRLRHFVSPSLVVGEYWKVLEPLWRKPLAAGRIPLKP